MSKVSNALIAGWAGLSLLSTACGTDQVAKDPNTVSSGGQGGVTGTSGGTSSTSGGSNPASGGSNVASGGSTTHDPVPEGTPVDSISGSAAPVPGTWRDIT